MAGGRQGRARRPRSRRLLLALTAVTWFAPATALADQTVVSATIYPSAGAGISTRAVSLSTLEGCPLFSGSNPMYLYPSQSPYQWATDSTWTVATVAECGLGIPSGAITDVEIRSPSQGYESLSASDLTNLGNFHDPLAPDALPVISSEPGEDLNTYFRPWRGGADDNAQDKVTEFGAPISIVVFEHGTPLTVAISSTESGAAARRLSATVSRSDGTPVPVSKLEWSWDLGDGSTSRRPTLTHTYAAGRYIVTLEVTDPADGTGGTATTTLTIDSHPTTGTRRSGGGSQRDGAPSGPARSHGSRPGGRPGPSRGATSPRTGRRRRSRPAQRSAARAPAKASATAPSHAHATRHAPGKPTGTRHAPPHPTAPSRRHTVAHPRPRRPVPPATSRAPLVTGRLISDVSQVVPIAGGPMHAGSAPVAPAPATRQAVDVSPVPGETAGAVIVLLFAVGAGRELRGRRAPQLGR